MRNRALLFAALLIVPHTARRCSTLVATTITHSACVEQPHCEKTFKGHLEGVWFAQLFSDEKQLVYGANLSGVPGTGFAEDLAIGMDLSACSLQV